MEVRMVEIRILFDNLWVIATRILKAARAVFCGAPPRRVTTTVTEVNFEELPPEIQELARRANS
jgi:hypothetical protein